MRHSPTFLRVVQSIRTRTVSLPQDSWLSHLNPGVYVPACHSYSNCTDRVHMPIIYPDRPPPHVEDAYDTSGSRDFSNGHTTRSQHLPRCIYRQHPLRIMVFLPSALKVSFRKYTLKLSFPNNTILTRTTQFQSPHVPQPNDPLTPVSSHSDTKFNLSWHSSHRLEDPQSSTNRTHWQPPSTNKRPRNLNPKSRLQVARRTRSMIIDFIFFKYYILNNRLYI